MAIPRATVPAAPTSAPPLDLAADESGSVVSRSSTALLAEVEALQRQIRVSRVVEQATGVLMGFYGCPPEQATALILSWSETTELSARDVALVVVVAASIEVADPMAARSSAQRDGHEAHRRIRAVIEQLSGQRA